MNRGKESGTDKKICELKKCISVREGGITLQKGGRELVDEWKREYEGIWANEQ